MEQKLSIELVKAQSEAVMGCAAGILEGIPEAPAELRPGLRMAVLILNRTAEDMLLEAMVNGE